MGSMGVFPNGVNGCEWGGGTPHPIQPHPTPPPLDGVGEHPTIKELKQLHIRNGALLFSADASAMYTNIDTMLGITSISHLIDLYKDRLPHNFPKELFIGVLTTIMKNNIFSFGDTYWLQTPGTAMGTPSACAYAMISFGYYENTMILTTYHANLLYYKRYIDDILGVWLPSTHDNTTTWNSFKQQLNNWGTLAWVIQEP